MKELQLPLSDTTIKTLHAGEMVLLSGKLLTGRDQVHLRFTEALKRGKKLPVEIMQLIGKRGVLRGEGKFDEADKARMEIESKGYEVLDTPTGTSAKKVRKIS